MQRDYYKVLGVDPKASDDAIKKAYRKLAVKHHPDKVRGQGQKKAEERFKEITEAYYILGNAKKKQEYDAMRTGRGAFGFKGNFANAQGFDFEEILKQFYTSPGRPSGRRRKTSFSIFDDIFEDLSFSPRSRNMNYRFVNNEDDARRTGSLSSVDTDQRSVLKIPMMLAAGGGSVSFERAGRSISVKIPAGIQEGKSIRLKGEGKECPCCGKKGDLLLKISLK